MLQPLNTGKESYSTRVPKTEGMIYEFGGTQLTWRPMSCATMTLTTAMGGAPVPSYFPQTASPKQESPAMGADTSLVIPKE